MTSPRVMRAMASPTVSHLDPLMLALLDDVRARLVRMFRAPEGSLALAISGTGTSGMETAVANLVDGGTRVLVVVTGYFGDRLAQMCERYGATVTRLDVEWGRACDPDALRRALQTSPADIVAMVHAETSTGVLNPVEALARDRARPRCARHRRRGDVARRTSARRWRRGASMRATAARRNASARRRVWRRSSSRRARWNGVCKCRSFYFDLQLLEDYWLRRKYHHTMSSTLVYALDEALAIVEEEGLEARWARHERNHHALRRRVEDAGPVGAAAGGRAAVDVERRCASPTASTKRLCASTCSTSSTSRSAPVLDRWPEKSGASV